MNAYRIAKLAFAMVLISFLLSTAVSLWSLQSMARRNVREVETALAAQIYETISNGLTEPITAARTMARDRFLLDFLKEEQGSDEKTAVERMARYLTGIQKGMEYDFTFLVSDSSKRYYSCEGLSKYVNPQMNMHDVWYDVFQRKDEDYDVDVDIDETNDNAWLVFVNAGVRDEKGKFLGVCGVGVRMTNLQEMFVDVEEKYHVKLNLIDENRLVQVDTDMSNIEHTFLEDVKVDESKSGKYVYKKNRDGNFAVTRYVENLDWYLVVQSNGGGERGQFVNVILLNVLLCLAVMAILIVASRVIMKRTIDLTNASFRDQITLLYNRRAYEEEITRLSAAPLEDDFVCVTADVNGLKRVNDTLGHDAGDELIKGWAQCLKACFGKYGKLFRIGGDEFAAMLFLSEEQLKQAQEKLERTMETWTGEKVDKLAISCGYASRREFPDGTLEEISKISDERMYTAKAEYYRRAGIDRRRN